MLHDSVMSRNARSQPDNDRQQFVDPNSVTTELDRRESDRIPFPAELVLAWNHDLSMSMRYRVIDAGDGGYRIHSSLPILEGTTGIALRLLPGGRAPLDQAVMVIWIRPSSDEDGFDVGLRCF